MKKPITTFCLALLGLSGFAQATRTAVKDTLNTQEKYTVLKSDPRIRQGKYTLYDRPTGKILTTGFYTNNKKNGIWRDYNYKDRVIAEGEYKDGQKVGEWKYYDDLWRLSDKYDFSRNALTYHRATHADSIRIYQVPRGKDTLSVRLDRPPIYLGGDALMYRNLQYNLPYPADAQRRKISAKVIISFTVDENGNTRDYQIYQGASYDLNLAAMKAIKLIPNAWVPGMLHGKNVPVVLHLPVAFKVDD